MQKEKTTIEQYAGTIMESVPEATDVIVEKVLKQLVYNVKETSETFRQFCLMYLDEKTPLKDIPGKMGISKLMASAWAADIIGTVQNMTVGYNRKPEMDKKEVLIDERPSKCQVHPKINGMDIFEYAKQFNADYMDMYTGIIYHIQDYNHAKRMGIPNLGIRVSQDGNTLGYIRE